MSSENKIKAGLIILVATTGIWCRGSVDFERYQVILNRRPFGAEAVAGTDQPVAVEPVQTGPSFADKLKIVAFSAYGGELRIGFVDSNANPPKTYMLAVGESKDGIEVVSADYDEQVAVLRKEGDSRTLKMAGSESRSAPAALAANTGAASVALGAMASGSQRRPMSARPTHVHRVVSPGRQLRMEEEQRRLETVPELHGQVLEKHLQEYNMQVIREGAPALPIPLTPEQDAALVQEGILPPP